MDQRLAGGRDEGAALVDGTVRRPVRGWTHTVHDLLSFLEVCDFPGAPRVVGVDGRGREMLTYLQGRTVGHLQPWPAWTHSGEALDQVGGWLGDYHHVVADYIPPRDAVWREGQPWQPGLIVGHGDPAPYNAVWNDAGLVGFIDWDNAGPVTPEDDLAWVAFSWVPLHARAVVMREGFTAFSARRSRLERLLTAYGWQGTTQDLVQRVDARIHHQITVMRATAAKGDPAYRDMLVRGLDGHLESARRDLQTL